MAVIDCFKVLDQKGSAPVKVQLHYLEPIAYEEYAGMKAAEVAALVKARIQACLDANSEA
jgi:1-acyl-sn-glycerol-3-phosphate acyltransferase